MRRTAFVWMALPVAVAGLAAATTMPVAVQSPPGRAAVAAPVGWLGLALSCIACEGIGRSGPLVVRAVTPGGPAANVLQPGDTIVAVNRTITDPARMRDALSVAPVHSDLEFVVHGTRGRYTIRLRKQPARYRSVAGDTLPIKYEGAVGGVGVEVLTPEAPVISRDSSGAMLIRMGGHVVRLTPPSVTPR